MAEGGDKPAAEGEDYFPISAASLVTDSVPKFDIYLRHSPGEPFVLYRSASATFTDEARERLVGSHVTRVYVKTSQESSYHSYIEEHLAAILSDPSVPSKQKATVLYDTASAAMRDIFEDPTDRKMIPRTKRIVENTMQYVLTDDNALANVLEQARLDYALYSHSVHVCTLSVALAHAVGIEDRATIRDLAQGALLHDIGKSRLEHGLLFKPGALNDDEWVEMKRHPLYGDEILRKQGVTNKIILDVTRHHHENMDGSGYPDGIEADAITPFVRISSVCDKFDALTARRTYREAMSKFDALKLMGTEMKHTMDPIYFDEFVRILGPTRKSSRRRLYRTERTTGV